MMLERIGADAVEATAKAWRIGHLPNYTAALPWLTQRADLVVDTTELTQHQVAGLVWDTARDRVAYSNVPHAAGRAL